MRGFEPPTSWPQTTRSTKLSYTLLADRVGVATVSVSMGPGWLLVPGCDREDPMRLLGHLAEEDDAWAVAGAGDG